MQDTRCENGKRLNCPMDAETPSRGYRSGAPFEVTRERDGDGVCRLKPRCLHDGVEPLGTRCTGSAGDLHAVHQLHMIG